MREVYPLYHMLTINQKISLKGMIISKKERKYVGADQNEDFFKALTLLANMVDWRLAIQIFLEK